MDVIFNEENAKHQEIKEKDLKKLTNIVLKLTKKDKLLNENFNKYIKNKLNQRTTNKYTINLIYKKNKIFEIINNPYDSLIKLKGKGEEKEKEKTGFFGYFWGKDNNKEKKVDNTKNDGGKVDVTKFDINGFRKEFNLSEDEFPDELLKEKYIESKGNKNIMFYKVSGLMK